MTRVRMLVGYGFKVRSKLSLRRMKPWFYIISPVICALVWLLALAPSWASANTGISVCPAAISFETPAGFNEIRVIKVSNNGMTPIAVKAGVAKIVKDSDGNATYADINQEDANFSKWLKVNPSRFTIKPRSFELVKLTLSLPERICLNKQRAAILFDAGDAKGRNVSIMGRVASTVTLNPHADPAPRITVEGFESGGFNIGTPPVFDIKLKNEGTVPFKASGRVEIRSSEDELVREIMLPDINIPSGSRKKLAVKSDKALPIGKYKCSLYIINENCFKEPITNPLIVFPSAGFFGIVIMILSTYFLLRIRKPKG